MQYEKTNIYLNEINSTTKQTKLACFNGNDIHLTFLKAEMEILISVQFFLITVSDVRPQTKNVKYIR